MATLHQLVKKGRNKTLSHKYNKKLEGRPQLQGICVKVRQMKPKKPHSAQRKIAWVRLSTGITVIAYIPGEGHSLQEHGVVLVRGGRTKDCPGVHYKLIRGKGELASVVNRKTSLSKYTAKK